MYEKKIAELIKQLKDEHAHAESVEEQLNKTKKLLNDSQKTIQVSNVCHQKDHIVSMFPISNFLMEWFSALSELFTFSVDNKILNRIYPHLFIFVFNLNGFLFYSSFFL